MGFRRLSLLANCALLASASNDPSGHALCPCVLPNLTTWCAASDRASHDGSCYSQSYGASNCDSHDANLSSECLSKPCLSVGGSSLECTSTTPSKWCNLKWCWVDPNKCSLPHDKATTWFSEDNELHYSYETCGNLNGFDVPQHEVFLKSLTDLRISFPGDSGSGYTILHSDGYAGLDVNSGSARKMEDSGRVGSTVTFFDEVWKEYGRRTYTVVRVSQASRDLYTSSFDACVHELALGTTDACIGNFWTTSSRQEMASFTSTILYEDEFKLLVHKGNPEETNYWSQIVQPVLLFDSSDWIAIFAFLFYAALVIWIMEGASNEEDFPERKASTGLSRSLFYQMQGFWGNGDFRYSPHTSYGRIVILSVSYAMLISVTHFTAAMTAQEVAASTVSGRYLSLDELLTDRSSAGKLCGLLASKKMFIARYPRTASIYQGYEKAKDVVDAMEAGECRGAIVTTDEWARLRKQKTHCNKILLPETLFNLNNAYAMRNDLVQPFAWAMSKLLAEGKYDGIRQAAQKLYLSQTEDECGADAEVAADNAPPPQRVVGPVLVATSIVTATLLVFVVKEVLRIRRYEDAMGEDDIPMAPSIVEQYCGKMVRALSREKSRSSIRLQDALDEIQAGNKDLKTIRSVFEGRHNTSQRLKFKVKGDAPLTVADVPMLVHLFNKSDKGDGNVETV